MRALVFLVCLLFGINASAQYQPRPKPPTSGAPSYEMPEQEIYIDLETLPQPRFGYNTQRIRVTTDQPSYIAQALNQGAFRTPCTLSHVAFDDPIVYPGQSGRTHLHQFFGNTRTRSSTDLLNMATAGNSTCAGGTLNRSGYWTPVVVYHRPGHARDGEVLFAKESLWYYKCSDSSFGCDSIRWAPPGLRMITGLATNKNPAALPGRIECWKNGGPVGAFPGYAFNHIPTAAEAAALGGCDELNFLIAFPQCWDGVNLDSPDHISHMRTANPSTGCFTAHPTLLPLLTLNVKTPINDADLPYLRLSSDQPAATATGLCATAALNYCAGATLHADFVNGWNTTDVIPALGTTLTNAINTQCHSKNRTPTGNRDCSANLIGAPNGDGIYYTLY